MVNNAINIVEKQNKHLFIDEINRRRITKLVHVTTNLNLCSILKHKLILSRKELEESNDLNLSNCDVNDAYRMDGKDHVNCSIEKINNRMFLPIKRNLDSGRFFCILAIDPKYLYRESTKFSVTNAANRYNREEIGIDGSYEKFVAMFAHSLSYQTSRDYRVFNRNLLLADNVPTDIQAEVLIYDSIPVSDIISIFFENESNLQMIESVLEVQNIEYDKRKLNVDPTMFST